MRQYAGFGTAADTNKRYKYLLEHGQTGLSVAFDLPTQIGYDSDHSLSLGEVGKVGVAIDTLADMETLFDGIPMEKVSTSMTINSTAAALLAMYIAVAEKQGISADKLNGTIQNDILKEYVARGTYIYPPQPSMRIITDIFAFCKDHGSCRKRHSQRFERGGAASVTAACRERLDEFLRAPVAEVDKPGLCQSADVLGIVRIGARKNRRDVADRPAQFSYLLDDEPTPLASCVRLGAGGRHIHDGRFVTHGLYRGAVNVQDVCQFAAADEDNPSPASAPAKWACLSHAVLCSLR
jgi:hypothetical protein